MEEWRNIPGYEGEYQVSNLGRVRSLERIVRGRPIGGHIKIEATHYKGHKKVWLNHAGKRQRYFVHRLVAIAFIPQVDPERIIVNHKDGDKKNNRVENLEWMTVQENTLHYYREILGVETDEDVDF